MPPVRFLLRLYYAVLLGVLMLGAAQAQDTTGTPPAPPPQEEQEDPPEQEAPASQQEPAPEAPPQESQAPPRPSPQPAPPPSAPDTVQAAPQRPPRTEALPAAPDTAAARPRDPAMEALDRIRAAAADSAGLAPTGVHPPLPPALAGIVWAPPEDRVAALDDLLALRRAGVRAIRTGLIADTLLLRAADVLGLAFYQDLPIVSLPAPVLMDTLAFAERLLTEALRRAQPYASARHFGLALLSDTSDPRARPYFERLTALVRAEGPPGSRTYYLSRFARNDRCARTVDFVLLDARDANPLAVLRRWRAQHETPAGIGAFGAAVRPGRTGGWRTPGTPAAQARRLESGLGGLLALETPPEALFIFRWTDAREASRENQRAEVEGMAYGLLGEEGTPRPALDVVQGFFTGTQRIFAFDAGSGAPEARTVAPLVLLGWVILLALGLIYWLAPRFGTLGSRYFGRHDLYLESVQRGYDLNAGTNSLLGAAVGLAVGVVWTAVLQGLGRTDALASATSGWSPTAQVRLNTLLGEPFALVLLIALAYALWILANMVWLYVLAGRRYRIRPQQALTLAVWSRWPALALMVGAMLLATVPPRTATSFAPVLLGIGFGVELVALGRMLYDFASVSRVPTGRALLLGFGAPVGLLFGALLVAFLTGRAELGFLWHLATRS